MSTKSNFELEYIISSDGFVEDAKQAAAWELDNRNLRHNYRQPEREEFIEDNLFLKNKNSFWNKYHEGRLLTFGITCVICAIYFFSPTVFTTKNSLTQIEGNLNTASIFIENVSSGGAKSRRATLYFYIEGNNKRFKLVENIGQNYSHNKFIEIKKQLNASNNVSVWINKNDIEKIEPKIFQIDIDGKTVIDIDSIKSNDNIIFLFMILLGASSIAFLIYRKYPDKINKIGDRKASR